MSLTARIHEKAVDLGFDLVGVAPAVRPVTTDAYEAWLDAGYQADMGWLDRRERRGHPQRVLEGARSIVTLGVSYFVEHPAAALWADPARGRFACYAWGPDYHDVLAAPLATLADFIRQESGPGTTTRYYVDTGPILERAHAARGGLGFIGKNTMLISPAFGSLVFLAEILTTAELEFDIEEKPDHEMMFPDAHGHMKRATCGDCRRCLDICPTQALPAPYVLDSRRCISYLTIELKGAIPPELRPQLGNWVYGCDDCQSVCPWVRRHARPGRRPFLQGDPDRVAPPLLDLMALDEEAFRRRFRGTAVLRTKRRGLLRNVAVALGNWGSREALPLLEQALNDPEPLVREHAAWAVARIEGQGA